MDFGKGEVRKGTGRSGGRGKLCSGCNTQEKNKFKKYNSYFPVFFLRNKVMSVTVGVAIAKESRHQGCASFSRRHHILQEQPTEWEKNLHQSHI